MFEMLWVLGLLKRKCPCHFVINEQLYLKIKQEFVIQLKKNKKIMSLKRNILKYAWF